MSSSCVRTGEECVNGVERDVCVSPWLSGVYGRSCVGGADTGTGGRGTLEKTGEKVGILFYAGDTVLNGVKERV